MPKPPPLPEARECANCGALDVHERGRCPNCGYFPPSPTNQALVTVVFILIGIPALCLGGCFVLAGSGDAFFMLPGLGGIALFFILLTVLIRSHRKRP